MVSDLQTTARTRPHEHHIDQVTMEDYEVKTHEQGVRSLLCCWTIYLQARHRGKHLTKTMQPAFARQCCLNMVHRGCNMKVVFILWEGRSIDSRQCYGLKISIIKELLAVKAYGHRGLGSHKGYCGRACGRLGKSQGNHTNGTTRGSNVRK